MAKVFITRYALTSGIREVEAEIEKSSSRFGNIPDYVTINAWTLCYIGKDAFLKKEDAIKKAEEMRKRKIASLLKQIEKLEKLIF